MNTKFTWLITGFLIFLATLSYCQKPSILWRFNTLDEANGNAAMDDLLGDGRLEIAFGCYTHDSNLYVLHAEDGSLLWKKNLGGCNDAAPIIYDVLGNGKKDIILASSCNPVITCFEGDNGKIIWQTPFGGADSPPSIDNDTNGKPQLFVGDFEGRLSCYSADSGKLKWQVMVDDSSWTEGSPALVDVNGDGQPDIIMVTCFFSKYDTNSTVYAYDGRTHKLLWKNHSEKGWIYHGAAFGPVSEDGHPELALSSWDGHVYLLNGADGTLKWAYPTPALACVPDPVAIGDINNDGHLELVYEAGNGNLNADIEALDRFGNLKWSFSLPNYDNVFRGVALADVNNDDTLDVIFASATGRLYALNGSRGNLLWYINLRTDYGDSLFGLSHGPVIASFKNDDTLDVFVQGGYANDLNLPGDFGRAYGIKVGKGKGPDWMMFQHDYARSNCVCNPSPAAVKNINEPSLQVQDYPNPFSENVNFNISLDKPVYVSVIIYNTQGIAVKTFANSKLARGNYEFSWNGKNDYGGSLPDGVYYCRIVAGNYISVKKVVRVR